MTSEAGDIFACHVLKIRFTVRVAIKCHYIVMHDVISDGKMKSHKMFLIFKKISKWPHLINITARHWKTFLQGYYEFSPFKFLRLKKFWLQNMINKQLY